jgi:hypothetical protein
MGLRSAIARALWQAAAAKGKGSLREARPTRAVYDGVAAAGITPQAVLDQDLGGRWEAYSPVTPAASCALSTSGRGIEMTL